MSRGLSLICVPVAAMLLTGGPGGTVIDPAPDVDTELLLQQATAAHRAGQCDGAQQLLQPLVDREDAHGLRGRLLAGLYAHACENPQRAANHLERAAGADPDLEDWRYWVLADSAAANGQRDAALTALTRLLARHPDSPLRARAIHRAATLAREVGQQDRTTYLIAMARHEELTGEPGQELELLAWQLAGANRDLEAQRESARHLLTHFPLKAAELRVVELFREPSGAVPWSTFLSFEQLMTRSRSLIAAGLADNAVLTLEQVPADQRDLSWRLLLAEALVSGQRGTEALQLLTLASPRDPGESAQVEWWRAMAALDMASTRSSRASLDADARATMRRAAREHLLRVVREDADRDLAIAALRRLFTDLAEAGEFESSVEVLTELRRLDPSDTTGARHLWALGWREYSSRNWTGAIGSWADLIPLYGGSIYARAGRYWSARAYEALGQSSRAAELYRGLLTSDTTDFYRRQAESRLGQATTAHAEQQMVQPTDPWPEDPLLARVERLANLALPDLALAELEALSNRSNARAVHAVRGRVLYGMGNYRAAIQSLSRTFPALGTALQGSVPVEARQIYYPLAYRDTILQHARAQGIPSDLVYAIVRQESAFDAAALSRSGARGLMQVMPATGREVAQRLGLPYSLERLNDPEYSVRLGTAYFRQVLNMFAGNEELALAGYNNGPFRIKRLWSEAGPNAELDLFLEGLAWDETRYYVKRILIHQDSYRQLYPGQS